MSAHTDLLAAFLDVSSTFDKFIRDILLQKLASLGCSNNVLTFVKFLTHQRVIYTDSLEDELIVIGKDVPQ